MAKVVKKKEDSIWWYAPEYFSRWRLFPRAFITMYIYLLWRVVEWFMALEDPSMNQAGLVSVVVGAGAAWFGLYVNSTSTKFDTVTAPEDIKTETVYIERVPTTERRRRTVEERTTQFEDGEP